jgi:hypothetical protein
MAINVGNLIVKNKPVPPKVEKAPAVKIEQKSEEPIIERFYKNSRYMNDMINN